MDDEDKAKALAQALVEKQLAVCVQISAQGTSVYQWQGKVNTDKEYFISIKTNESHQQAVITWLESNHPYETPEIISLNAEASQAYNDWLSSCLPD